MDSKLLTEIERQEAVLAELPEDYEFPLFDGRQAIESQRKSAYKNTARAAREIIDNAYEGGAKNVWVVFKRPSEEERGKRERRDAVAPRPISPAQMNQNQRRVFMETSPLRQSRWT